MNEADYPAHMIGDDPLLVRLRATYAKISAQVGHNAEEAAERLWRSIGVGRTATRIWRRPMDADTPEIVEAVARALCIEDGYDPDKEIIGSQCTGFENFGPLWQANERSENTLGGRNYVRDARAAIAATRPFILEEAAKVADEAHHAEGLGWTPSAIARHIRALAIAPPDPQ